MTEPRRSTRARAREEAAAAPETPKETPVKAPKGLKRKRASHAVKDSTPATPTQECIPKEPKFTLPFRLPENGPLPTLSEPQPLDLPASEWQTIPQSQVLKTSLDRSRAVWISGVNFRVFHRRFEQPKKPAERTEEDRARYARQKELIKNFPEIGAVDDKKSGVKGADKSLLEAPVQAHLVIEPHTFPIRLYGPREVIKQVVKKQPTYGAWPNHNQHPHPNQYTYNHGQQYQRPPPPPQPRPPPPKPVQKPPTPAPATPAPDPVIHMLAARAGQDPELKAVMRVVAAGKASKEQLEFFQNHITELTEMLAQKTQVMKSAKPTPKPSIPATPQPAAVPTPPRPTPPMQQQPLQVKPELSTPKPPGPMPPPASNQPVPTQPTPALVQNHPPPPPSTPNFHSPAPPQSMSKPYTPTPAAPLQRASPYPPHPPHPSQALYPQHYNQAPTYHPPQQVTYPAPPKTSYRPLVFSFTEGNGDLLYFPSYSFMEMLPNRSGAKFSFLITKMKPEPPPTTQPPTTAPSTPLPPTPTPQTPANPQQPAPIAQTPANPPPNISTPNVPQVHPPLALTPNPHPPPTNLAPAQLPQPRPPPQRIEDFDDATLIPQISLYQPVTALILTTNADIKAALPRAVRPPENVERYMERVFDECGRAGERYLAFRLPRDGREGREGRRGGTPVVAEEGKGTVVPLVSAGAGGEGPKRGAGRPRKNAA